MANILVVDDSTSARGAMVKLLKYLGHRPIGADSAEAAFEQIHTAIPDLMILDIMMPGTDGLTMLSKLRADPRTHNLKVIMFSAMADEQRIAEAKARGADDYWVKASFDYSRLSTQISKHLHSEASHEATSNLQSGSN